MIKRMEIWTGAEFAFLIPSVWAEKLDSSIKTKTNTNPQVWKPGRLETSRDEKSVVKSVPTPAPPRGTRSWEGTQRLLASVRASRWLVWIFGDWTLTGKTNLVVLVVTEQTRKKMSGLNLTIVQDLWPNQPETGNRFNKAKLPFYMDYTKIIKEWKQLPMSLGSQVPWKRICLLLPSFYKRRYIKSSWWLL